MTIPTFRLDISDPVVCKEGKHPLLFSFEDAIVHDANDAAYPCATLALAVGLAPWLGKWLISEAGLRALALAATTAADHAKATRIRYKRGDVD